MLTTIRRKLRDDNGPTDKLGPPETALEYNGGYIPTEWLPPPLLPHQYEVCATIIPVDSATPPCAFVFGAEIDAALKLMPQVMGLVREWIANGRSGYSLPVIRGELLDQLVAQAEAATDEINERKVNHVNRGSGTNVASDKGEVAESASWCDRT